MFLQARCSGFSWGCEHLHRAFEPKHHSHKGPYWAILDNYEIVMQVWSLQAGTDTARMNTPSM
jgi:hypothetical protein